MEIMEHAHVRLTLISTECDGLLEDWAIHYPPVKQCNSEPLRGTKKHVYSLVVDIAIHKIIG